MKRLTKTSITVLLCTLICAFTFAACATPAGEKDWVVDWDKFQPEGGLPSLPEDGSGDEEETPDNEDTPAPAVSYSYMIKSNTSSLNIRSAPNTGAAVVGKMDKGDMLRFEGESNGWYKTVYKQKTAYVYAGNSYAYIVKMTQSNEKVESVIAIGETLMGYPYVWGSQRYHWGNGKLNTNFVQGEYDCSALMQYIYYHGANINLDLTTRTQVLQGREVASGDLQRGDLMFFTNSSRYNLSGVERIGHVALYLGDKYILHTASDFAVIEEISSTRWKYFIVAKRFVY